MNHRLNVFAARLRRYVPGALSVGACVVLTGVSISAPTPVQPATTVPSAVQDAAPGEPDDLSGVWLIDRRRSNAMPSPNNRDPSKPLTLIDGTVIPLRPEFEKIYRERSKFDETEQPYAGMSSRCLPPGTPFNMMGPPYPMHIVENPDFIAILLEESWTFRAIYMNDTHPDQLVPGFMGHSIGHWDGKTLVIETVGIRADVPLTGGALTHSAQLKLTERLTRESPDVLLDRIEINDPVNYTKPFTFLSYFNRTKEQQIEYVCEVNNIEVSPEGRQIYHDVK